MLRRQPFTHARPATGRYMAGIRRAGDVIPPTDPVYRDPCPRCGSRGDLECGHGKARLGMVL